jgi:nitronate monooxygenase
MPSLEKILLQCMDRPRYPIIQGGMGAGISLYPLASECSKHDIMGTLSSVALDQYTSARVGERLNLVDAVCREIIDTKDVGGFAAINIMVKLIGTYKDSIEGAVKGGANMIISGAGLPAYLPNIVKEFANKHMGTEKHNIALVPIVSSAEALIVLLERYWLKQEYIPDAIVLEGPKAGGHLGFSYKAVKAAGKDFLAAYDLFDVLLDPVLEIAQKYNIPVFVAGGIRTRAEIDYAISRGATGVQIATPFVPTYESGASEEFKQMILRSSNAEVMLSDENWGSPALYPFRYLKGSPLAQKKKGKSFCICAALVSSTDPAMQAKEGPCPEHYVLPSNGKCPAFGNVLYEGLYTSGTEIDSLIEMRSAADVIHDLVQ